MSRRERIEENLGALGVMILIALVLMLLFSGCGTGRKYIYVPVTETVTETITERDTTVEVRLVERHDTVSVPAYADTLSYLSNDYAYSWARYSNGMMYHSLGVLPGAKVEAEVKYIEREKKIEVPKVVEVEKPLTSRQKILIGMGKCSAVLVAVAAILLVLILWIRRKGVG